MSENLTYSAFESRYQDKQYIGAGGFGKVYKVFDHAKNHYVALKVADVRPEWNKFTLKNEVELVNKLEYHRNIARYDACYRFNTGITGEMDFAILKFYEYGNLEQFLNKENLNLNDKKLIIRGILSGINFLHVNNVIHRDIKAENILISREDGVWTPKITDFGLSRKIQDDNTITNSAIGISYAYAAPEQILNKKIDKNVDLWAIGVIIYRIIEGDLPFGSKKKNKGKTMQTQLDLTRKIVNMELPEALDSIAEPYQSIIKRCLVFENKERVQSAQELLTLLNGGILPEKKEDLLKNVFEGGNPDKTEVIRKEVSLNGDDKTEIILPKGKIVKSEKKTTFPPSYTPPPKDYTSPNLNPTVILKDGNAAAPVSEDGNRTKKPEVVKSYEPSSGSNKSKFSFWWVLIPLLVIGIGAGGWYAWDQGFLPGFTTNTDAEEPELIEAELITIGGDKGTNNISLQNKSIMELQELAKNNTTNYDIQYTLAKSYMEAGKTSRSIIRSLNDAAEIAVENKDAKKMLADMERDGEKVFEKITSSRSVKMWDNIIAVLENAKK